MGAAFNLHSYEENNVKEKWTPPDNEIHVGLDGRLYSIVNFQWRPLLPPSVGERFSPIHRFSPFRLGLLVQHDESLSIRCFHRNTVISENAHAMLFFRQLVDVKIHKVINAVQGDVEPQDDTLVSQFKLQGYNRNLLGILLLSLLRLASPPTEVVRTVITEMFARSIKAYVQSCVLHESHHDDGEALQPFPELLTNILKNMLSSPGYPVPHEASSVEPAVLLPNDVFGGEIIPLMYSKFRLLFQDVDLFQSIPDAQRLAIFHRTCELLGTTIRNGSVTQVLPFMLVGFPDSTLPAWVHLRVEQLARRYLLKSSLVSDWKVHGPALAALLKHQPKYWRFFEVVQTHVQQLSSRLELHLIEFTAETEKPTMEKLLKMREKCTDAVDQVLLLKTMRTEARNSLSRGDPATARAMGENSCQLAKKLLGTLGSHFAAQFRRTVGEFVSLLSQHSSMDLVLKLEEEAVRMLSRYCESDPLIAMDFASLATIQYCSRHHEEAAANFARALRTLMLFTGESDPRVLRLRANLIMSQRPQKLFDALRPLGDEPNCPKDLLRFLRCLSGEDAFLQKEAQADECTEISVIVQP